MKQLLFFSAFILLINSVFGQIKDESFWQDGELFYQATIKGDIIDLFGGNLHEGGAWYHLRQCDKGFVSLDCDYKEIRDSVRLQKMTDINGEHDVLVFYSQNGKPNNVLIQFNTSAKDVFDETSRRDFREILENYIHQFLEGQYANEDGTEYRFESGKLVRKTPFGKTEILDYQIEYDLDLPTPLISLSNGEHLWISPTIVGMDIYEPISHIEVDEDFQWWSKSDTLVGSLKKVSSTTTQPGRWPFASTHILTPGILGYFKKEELRIMRNEIYARHGYVFSDEKLQDFFQSQPWYQPITDNSKVQLSPLEVFNIQIIKQTEKSVE